MTPLVVQSDIEAARKMIAERRSEADVVAMLIQRRIDPAKAEKVVRDLLQGLPVEPDMQANQEAHYKNSRQTSDEPASGQQGQTQPRRRRRHSNHTQPNPAIKWIILLLAILIGCVVYFGFIRSPKPGTSPVPAAPGGDSAQAEKSAKP